MGIALRVVLVCLTAATLAAIRWLWRRAESERRSAADDAITIDSGKEGIQLKIKVKPKLLQIKKPLHKFLAFEVTETGADDGTDSADDPANARDGNGTDGTDPDGPHRRGK